MRLQSVPEKELITEWGLRKFLSRWLTQQLIQEEDYHPGGKGRPRKVYSSRGVREESLSNIDMDDPLTWPRQAFEWIRGAHNKWVETPQETPSTSNADEASTELGGSTDGTPVNLRGDQNQSFTVNSPDSEQVDKATISKQR